MKKYKMHIFEQVFRDHEVIFASDAPASDIDKILDEAVEKGSSLDDVIYTLKEHDCNVLNIDRDDDEFGKIEIDEFEEMEEESRCLEQR